MKDYVVPLAVWVVIDNTDDLDLFGNPILCSSEMIYIAATKEKCEEEIARHVKNGRNREDFDIELIEVAK